MITLLMFLICFIGLVLPYDYFVVASDNLLSLSGIFFLFAHQLGHANWQHLLGNFLFMTPFSVFLEAKLGPKRFLALFFSCGVFAALFQFLLSPPTSLIGASGAASGVFAAACVLFGQAVWQRILGFGMIALSIYPEIMSAANENTHIAHWAHVGGMIAGTLIALAITNRNQNQS